MKLTDIKCKTAKPSAKSVKMSDGGGMYLEIMPNGSKYWRLKYRMRVKDKLVEKRLSIGVYPEISLKEARERREEAKRLLEKGLDPSLEKQKAKTLASQDRANTFQSIALEWYESRKDMWKPRYAAEVIVRLENDIFPAIGNYPIKDIEPPILLAVIKRIEKRGAHELAKRQLQKCGEITEGQVLSHEGPDIEKPHSRRIQDIQKTQSELRTALETVRSFGSKLANELNIIQTREGLAKNMIITFEEGNDKLTLADQNEESAKLLALQVRQSMQHTALAFKTLSVAEFL